MIKVQIVHNIFLNLIAASVSAHNSAKISPVKFISLFLNATDVIS